MGLLDSESDRKAEGLRGIREIIKLIDESLSLQWETSPYKLARPTLVPSMNFGRLYKGLIEARSP